MAVEFKSAIGPHTGIFYFHFDEKKYTVCTEVDCKYHSGTFSHSIHKIVLLHNMRVRYAILSFIFTHLQS